MNGINNDQPHIRAYFTENVLGEGIIQDILFEEKMAECTSIYHGSHPEESLLVNLNCLRFKHHNKFLPFYGFWQGILYNKGLPFTGNYRNDTYHKGVLESEFFAVNPEQQEPCLLKEQILYCSKSKSLYNGHYQGINWVSGRILQIHTEVLTTHGLYLILKSKLYNNHMTAPEKYKLHKQILSPLLPANTYNKLFPKSILNKFLGVVMGDAYTIQDYHDYEEKHNKLLSTIDNSKILASDIVEYGNEIFTQFHNAEQQQKHVLFSEPLSSTLPWIEKRAYDFKFLLLYTDDCFDEMLSLQDFAKKSHLTIEATVFLLLHATLRHSNSTGQNIIYITSPTVSEQDIDISSMTITAKSSINSFFEIPKKIDDIMSKLEEKGAISFYRQLDQEALVENCLGYHKIHKETLEYIFLKEAMRKLSEAISSENSILSEQWILANTAQLITLSIPKKERIFIILVAFVSVRYAGTDSGQNIIGQWALHLEEKMSDNPNITQKYELDQLNQVINNFIEACIKSGTCMGAWSRGNF